MHHSLSRWLAATVTFAAALVAGASAASVADDIELQKKLANPVSDLISVPIQYNLNVGTGPYDKPQHTLNIQPVYPMKLGSSGWSLINRVIVPLLSNPALAPGQERENGVGDILYQPFFSPAPSGGLVWGIGPALQLRSATDDRLGSGKWATGPTAVGLVQEGAWSLGALVTQLWSFAGDDNRADVNQMQLQPIISYRLSPKNTIGYAGIIVANWQHPSGQRWTVPLGATYSILTRPGWIATPVNYVFGGGYNVVRPDDASPWFVRFQVNFVFPK